MGKCQKRIVDRPKMYDRTIRLETDEFNTDKDFYVFQYNLITNEGEKVVISLIHTYFED